MEALAQSMPPPKEYSNLSDAICPSRDFVVALSITVTSSRPSLTVASQPSSPNPLTALLKPLHNKKLSSVQILTTAVSFLARVLKQTIPKSFFSETGAHLARRWPSVRRTAGCCPFRGTPSLLSSAASRLKCRNAYFDNTNRD